jgi:hypothetical protein
MTATAVTPLLELRERIDSLACEDGAYYLVCARTGVRPVPVDSERFPDRERARAAARAAEQYRDILRRHDPRLPVHDIIVCEETNPTPKVYL